VRYKEKFFTYGVEQFFSSSVTRQIRRLAAGLAPSTCQYHFIIASQCFISVLHLTGQAGKAWEPSNKTMLFGQTGSIGQQSVCKLLSQKCQWRMIKSAVAKCAIPVCLCVRNSGRKAEV